MLNSRSARNHINKLSQMSTKQPSFYFVHGYFMGLAVHPNVVMPSVWQVNLFGDLKLEGDDSLTYFEGVMWQYNQIMQSCMDGTYKLPAQCKLSPTDFESSLGPDAPLSQWCSGINASLDLIDKRKLSVIANRVMDSSQAIFEAFGSYQKLHAFLGHLNEKWQSVALSMRREMVYEISRLLEFVRFSEESEMETLLAPNDSDEEMRALLDFALYDESDEAAELVNTLINEFETQMGQAFFEENTGHLWMIHEARPYMSLLHRRAFLLSENGRLQEAISQLQRMLVLNPNDNQAARYRLVSLLVIVADWPELQVLLQEFKEDGSLPMLASKALMYFAQEGDSDHAKHAKHNMHQQNKHAVRYLTGQTKSKGMPELYQHGDSSEVEMYLLELGKKAWLSVDGALFWLRKKA